MRCIQHTIDGVTAFTRPGIAPDDALEPLENILGLRLHIAAGISRACCGAAVELVAIDPADPTLPGSVRASLQGLAPGHSVVDAALPELANGWIAMPGVDIRIDTIGQLGGPAIAITFDDAVAVLRADGGRRLVSHTTAVVSGVHRSPSGWRAVHSTAGTVPLLRHSEHQAACAA